MNLHIYSKSGKEVSITLDDALKADSVRRMFMNKSTDLQPGQALQDKVYVGDYKFGRTDGQRISYIMSTASGVWEYRLKN